MFAFGFSMNVDIYSYNQLILITISYFWVYKYWYDETWYKKAAYSNINKSWKLTIGIKK